ncbi:MAG: hypothetical protein JJ899_14710 [Alphaproteobacteria bacterium]|nr:hypothetical protein [Alphaproteobacteria bacterium]
MLDASTAVTKNTDNPFTEDDLHDYVDGRMDSGRRKEFEEFLQHNPEIAAVVEDYRRQNQMLRALFARERGGHAGASSGRTNGRGSDESD